MNRICIIRTGRKPVGTITWWGGWQLTFECAFYSKEFATEKLADLLKIPVSGIEWRADNFGYVVFEHGDFEYRLTEMPVY